MDRELAGVRPGQQWCGRLQIHLAFVSMPVFAISAQFGDACAEAVGCFGPATVGGLPLGVSCLCGLDAWADRR
jgi:hypothetical protein